MTLTDEMLLKYADGLLEAPTAQAVEAVLRLDDVASERLRLIRLSGVALRDEARVPVAPVHADVMERFEAAIGRSDGAEGPTVLSADARAGVSVWVRAARALAAGLMMLLAAGGGYLVRDRLASETVAALPVWVVRVADYHTLYGRRTVETVQTPAAEVPALEQKFSAALDAAVTIPLYGAEMEFRRGQLLEFEREPILQLAYLPADGTPMALCLKRVKAADAPATFERLNGIGLVRWRQRGIEYVLVADQSEQRLLGYAATAVAQITAARKL